MSTVDTEFKSVGGLGAIIRGRVAPVICGEVTANIAGRTEAGFREGPTDFFRATRAWKVFLLHD